MQAWPRHPPAQAFFLDADPGRRFCLYHPPQGAARGAVLHVPAHAEEMNKSRRMVAQQARLLAAQGLAVLQIDLYGCGDSDGLSGDARWDIWRDDVQLGLDWLRERSAGPLSLWGLRLGGLLALDAARSRSDLAALLLWHPVTDGAAYLNQFLRLRLAADMLAQGKAASGGAEALRRSLAEGASLDIAGYTLTPALSAGMAGASFDSLGPPSCPVHWLDLAAQPGRALAPARAALAARLAGRGWDLDTAVVQGPAFWASQEISEAPALLDASLALLAAEAR
ncbi:MAG: hydrolase 2, exosortase A system-associated [Noviherbaspirillum sp.]